MTKDKALKLALEALEKNNNDWKRLADSGDTGRWTAEETELYKQTEQAIISIKKALAQPTKFDPNDSFERDEAARATVREFMRNH